MLIFYTISLLYLYIISNSFLVESLGLSVYKTKSSTNSNSFTSSFLIWTSLFLAWLLWLCLPILCWIRVAKVDILVFFLILQGQLNFSPLSIMLNNKLVCHIWLLSSWGTFLTSLFYWQIFIINGYWILLNALSSSIEIIIWPFPLFL